ncbi:MAG: SDR family oxidoreductase [Bacteroidota bacterium]
MNLNIARKLFIVGGATSGFGLAVTKALIAEGAKVIAVARGEFRLKALVEEYPQQIEPFVGDLTELPIIHKLAEQVGSRPLDGMLVNAGGPPAMSFLETLLDDWDNAYEKVLRWKVQITKTFLPKFLDQEYGRILYIESVSVKQPIENLVLSNSLRLAVVGFVKTLSQEIADSGITLNILAPGYHATPAMDRLFAKKSASQGISEAEAKTEFENLIGVGFMGKPEDFASLAVWLLSPVSRYLTGQTISVDGGVVLGTMG